ncbi:MAG TPA: exopolysaccharide biosynthesis polyprenyl glycosylphosphotransferase [Gaiellaceae bacterium]|nr:exopolysaccharide biosynthesis polyprenyl glycosylphosphotransferase [Gaiellaceae bacterium]
MSAVHSVVAGRVGFGDPAGAAARGDVQSAPKRLRGRAWLVRRALLAADVVALIAASAVAVSAGGVGTGVAAVCVVLGAPLWVAAAAAYGLYDHDEERLDHSSVDELVGIFQLGTLGAWVLALVTWAAGAAHAGLTRLVVFWVAALGFVTVARAAARALARRSDLYVQRTLILGAGHIGQLAARKLLQHPEYRVELVGFVDAHPRPLREELSGVRMLGDPAELERLIVDNRIGRVIVAFSEAPHDELLDAIRRLRRLDVHIDLIPRLFEIVGLEAGIHACEGLSLVGLRTTRVSAAARALKRALDVAVTVPMLVAFAPLMVLIAVAIRVDSNGPALFRQQRLGLHMRPFTVLKFRTMRVDTDQDEHRRYIERTLTADAAPNGNGLYKLDRNSAVTRVGRLLRKTSLDELPQLLNVLAGDMSLVGPRPCLAYEADCFEEHQYERFLMPPGLTGLWQVTARARSTFGEALDMDVAYVRGWSLGLDLQLLLKTPLSLVRLRATT